MPLPDQIEIVPLDKPVHAAVAVPGSKSITNRALVLAALGSEQVALNGALWSEDTQVMVDSLQRLGFEVRVRPDPDELCNRTIQVTGRSGEIPNAGTAEKPVELFVGNAGTAARFLAAMVCLGRGVYRLSGVPRMHQRPQGELFKALRELGYRVDSPKDRLPAVIHGTGPHRAKCRVSVEESSQFASALLLSAPRGGWEVEVEGENAEESPYVAMSAHLNVSLALARQNFAIEPDASSGSYFWAAQFVLNGAGRTRNSTVSVRHWPMSDLQVDARFPLVALSEWPNPLSRLQHLGDSIMTAITIAPLRQEPSLFTDLGRLRVQECERVSALRTELTKCGASVVERGDTLEIAPSALHGAEIETYHDHRMAMCFAVLGLKVPGIRICNPACVKKTFPNFFQKLSAPPPHGLGVSLLHGLTGRPLANDDLFAE